MDEMVLQAMAAMVGATQVLRFVSWGLGKVAPRTETTVDDAILRFVRGAIVTMIQATEFLRGASPSRSKAEVKAGE